MAIGPTGSIDSNKRGVPLDVFDVSSDSTVPQWEWEKTDGREAFLDLFLSVLSPTAPDEGVANARHWLFRPDLSEKMKKIWGLGSELDLFIKKLGIEGLGIKLVIEKLRIEELGIDHPFVEASIDFYFHSPNAWMLDNRLGSLVRTVYGARFLKEGIKLGPSDRWPAVVWHHKNLLGANLPTIAEFSIKEGMPTAVADLEYLHTIIREHPDRLMKWYALQLAGYIALFMFMNGHSECAEGEEKAFFAVLETAFKSGDIFLVNSAWWILNRLRIKQPHKLVKRYWTPPPQPILAKSPEFGISKYFRRLPNVLAGGMLDKVNLNRTYFKTVSIRYLRPTHSLADFNPDRSERSPIMMKKYKWLKKIVLRVGLHKETVLREFFAADHRDERPHNLAVQVGPEEFYLMNIHHRMAALILAASEGFIPASWLDEMPLQVHHRRRTVSPAFLRYFFTQGCVLTWPDLFPAGTDFSRIPAFSGNTRDRPAGREKPAVNTWAKAEPVNLLAETRQENPAGTAEAAEEAPEHLAYGDGDLDGYSSGMPQAAPVSGLVGLSGAGVFAGVGAPALATTALRTSLVL